MAGGLMLLLVCPELVRGLLQQLSKVQWHQV
jgi:hypothetical protein